MIKPLPYQVDTVKQMHKFWGRCLLAHEMGLGKTLCALLYIKDMCRQRPVIVVCPASLKVHWQREAKQWCGMESTILYGEKAKGTALLRGKSLYIINYDILSGWLRFLKSLKPRIIVGDEIHYISSYRAKRSIAFKALCDGIDRVIGISGTPLTNRPWELYPILSILHPNEWHNQFAFGQRFCEAHREFGHWVFKGARNLGKLHHKLRKTCMIRYTKEEVLPQLPTKRMIVLPMEIDNRREYIKAETDLISWLAEFSLERARRAARDIRTRFGYLKRLAAQLKLKAVIEWIKNFLEESDGKLLVGAIHRSQTPIIPTLYNRFMEVSVQIHGGMSQTHRQKSVDAFKTNKSKRILIGQMQAAGVGHNFPEASTVALVELPWAPGTVQQFIDRAHRLTSEYPVDAYFLVAQDTIEETLCKILQRKSGVLDRVLDNRDTIQGTLDVWDQLQAALLQKEKK